MRSTHKSWIPVCYTGPFADLLKKISSRSSRPMLTRFMRSTHKSWIPVSCTGPFCDLFEEDFIDALKTNVDKVHTVNAQMSDNVGRGSRGDQRLLKDMSSSSSTRKCVPIEQYRIWTSL